MFKELPDIPVESSQKTIHSDGVVCSNQPVAFNEKHLSDLIRDLGLSKESAELLASRLKDRNLLQQGTKITFYRTHD